MSVKYSARITIDCKMPHWSFFPSSLITMTAWLSPPFKPVLTSDEIHVWKAELSCEISHLKHFSKLLSADEKYRAERFFFEKDRNHYILARGLLRSILGSYLSEAPKDIQFTYNAYGKPALKRDYEDSLQFNLSHSHGLALFAFAQHYEIGVDLEYIRTDFEWRQIVEQFFSVQEFKTLIQLPEIQQCKAFFEGWTRKEAYIKAKGQGLSIPLDQFDVSLAPEQPAELLRTCDPQEAAQWAIHALYPAENYVGALAIQGRSYILQYLQSAPQAWGFSD